MARPIRRSYYPFVTASRPSSIRPAALGALLRRWRSARRVSQLDLALQADISSRHLSYVETGKATPSREMVTRLAEALDVPLRERNALLLAAGYAPLYRETSLGARDLGPARQAIELMLAHHEPYPAIVVDRYWNLLQPNGGAMRLFGLLLGGPPADANVLRLVFRHDGVRDLIANWEEVAGDMIHRLQQECSGLPDDNPGRSLIDEVLSYPDIPAEWHHRHQAATPLLTVVFRKGGKQLRFFTTITTFGTPRDITLEELRIECSYPADEETAETCRDLARETED